MAPAAPAALPPYTGTLTPAHLAVVERERDRWRRAALSTSRANRPAAEAAGRQACLAACLGPPGAFVWMDSPLGGVLASVALCQLHGQDEGKLWGQLWGQVDVQLANQLSDHLGKHLWERLQREFFRSLWVPLQRGLRSRLWEWLWERLWDPLQHELQGRLWRQLRAQLADQLPDRPPDQLQHQTGDHLDQWYLTYQLARYRCALRIAGLGPSPRLEALAEAARGPGRGCAWARG